MIIELGHFAVLLALAVALVQMALPAWGARTGDVRLMQVAEPAALAQLGLLAFAFAALMHAYVTSDFSVENVWANSHSDKPLLYRISGVWGNHEGSMLLWVLILALFGAAVALFGEQPARHAARQRARRAGRHRRRLPAVHRLRLQPLRAHPAAARGPRPQSHPAGPGAVLPSALPLRRLRRPLDGLLLRHRRPDRRPHRCRLGALGAGPGRSPPGCA